MQGLASGRLCSHDEPPPRPGAWPSDRLSLGAMTAAMWVRAIYRYRSVSAILRLWSLVRVGSFQMGLRMYCSVCILRFRSKIGIVLHTAACFYDQVHHGREHVLRDANSV